MSTEWISLAQPLFNGMPRAAAHGDVSFEVEHHERPGLPGPPVVSVTKMEMAAHVGTHVDAARHFYRDGKTIDQYDPAVFAGPGVVLDLRREGVVGVSAAHLEAAQASVRRGDIVFVWFGYAERFRTPDYHDHPYLTADAAEWLVEREVRMVGVDTITPDVPPTHREPDHDFPVHMTLLGRDVLIVENLGPNLRRLANQRVEIVAVPFAICGADASPVVPLARICE